MNWTLEKIKVNANTQWSKQKNRYRVNTITILIIQCMKMSW